MQTALVNENPEGPRFENMLDSDDQLDLGQNVQDDDIEQFDQYEVPTARERQRQRNRKIDGLLAAAMTRYVEIQLCLGRRGNRTTLMN